MLNLTKSTETSFAGIPDTSFAGIQDGIALAQAIVDTVRDPLLVLDGNQRIVAASRSFHRTFVVDQELRGLLLHEIGGGQWDIPELRVRLQAMAQDHAAIEGFELDREFPAIGRRVMLLNAREVFYETGTHTTVLLAIEDVTERRAAERQMQELLKEKDMLLQEMQHRVANSLQIIASILLIKARNVKSEETRLQLHDAHQRVLSVAAVQQHLHSAGRGGSIEIGKYLSKLCSTLAESMIGDSQTIALKVDSDQGTLASHDAVSIGLIVTELVMNALKYAFAGGKPDAVILVSYKVADTDWQLTISDNGDGKAEIATGQVKTGLGTSLVQALAKQLDAHVETTSDVTGTAVSITHATFKSKTAEAGELLPA